MAQAYEVAVKSLQQIQKDLDGAKVMNVLESQLGTPKGYVAAAGAAVYLLLVTLNVSGTGQIFSNLAGLVLPGYFSLIALETSNKNDDTQWLTYWLVYAVFSVIEYWCSTLLYFIPLYWLYKTLLLLFLGLPQFKGAELIYFNCIKPLAHQFLQIDSAVKKAEKSAAAEGKSAEKAGGKSGKKGKKKKH